MEGKKAIIRYRKPNGDFGPGKVLEPNEVFVIGSEKGYDIRLNKLGRHCRQVFELNERGLVTLTDESLLDGGDSAEKRVFHQDDCIQIEGKTFCVQYQSVEDAAIFEAEISKKQRIWRRTFAPTIVPTEDNDNRLSKQYSDSTEVVTKTPQRLPTSSRKSLTPVTPIPARNTPSARRSMLQRQSMAMLPEEDESNSNDSKYKTPENTTPKIVMRSHKSSIKSKADGDDTPKCVTPLSNTKSRRSLLQYDDSDSQSSADESNVKEGVVRIIDTSHSSSGSDSSEEDDINEETALNINEETSDAPDTDDGYPQPGRQAKRGHDDLDDGDDDIEQQLIEPPKKRLKRDSVHSFLKQRNSSIAEAHQANISTSSKKSLGRVSNLEGSRSSLASLPLSRKVTPKAGVAPNTVPRLKQHSRQHTLPARQNLSLNSFHDFNEYADNSPQLNPSEFTFEDDAGTTHSSSFDYISGKDADRVSLGMSVFRIEQNDEQTAIGGDLMDFSTTLPARSRNSEVFSGTPVKHNISQRRSSRAIKPVEVFTPEKYITAPRTPKKTPVRKGILKESRPSAWFDPTESMDTSNMIPTTPVSLNNRSAKKTPASKVVSEESLDASSNMNELLLHVSRPQTPASLNKSSKKTLVTKGVLYDTLPADLMNQIDASSRPQTPTFLRRSSRPATPTLFTDYVVFDRTPGQRLRRSNEDLLENEPSIEVVLPIDETSVITSLTEGSKSANKKGTRTPKGTPAKTPKSKLFELIDLGQINRPRTPLSRVNASLIEDSSESAVSLAKKVLSISKTPQRTPAKKAKDIDVTYESDDSFIENKSTPYSLASANKNKKTSRLSNTLESSLLSANYSLMENALNASSQKNTPSNLKAFKNIGSSNGTPMKSSNLFDESKLRRSSRTPKSVFNTNCTLDESIFDTSTKQTDKSLRRSNSMGNSLSRSASKYSDILDNSAIGTKDTSLRRSSNLSLSMRKLPLSGDARSSIDIDDSIVMIKRGRGRPKKNASPSNDLTNVEGVKELMSTPKVCKEPKNDLTNVQGVKKLLGTPKVQSEPKNDLTDVRGVKKLLGILKVQKDPLNDLTDVRGVKNLLKTPKVRNEPKNDLTNVQGVKKLLATPKVQREPTNDLTDIRGVKNLLKTPKVRNEPKNDLTNVEGVKELFSNPKASKEPRNSLGDVRGLRQLMKTPKPNRGPLNDLTDVRGVKNLLGTPKEAKTPTNDLTNVAGVKRLLRTPKVGKEPTNDLSNIQGVKRLMQTPGKRKVHVADFVDVSGVDLLFGMHDEELDDENVTSTTNTLSPTTVEVPAKKARTRRGGLVSVETVEEPVPVPRRTRAGKAETPVAVVELTSKSRTTKRKVTKETDDYEGTPIANNEEPLDDDIPIKPVRKTRAVKKTVAVEEVSESPARTTKQKKPNKKQVQDDESSVENVVIKPAPKTRSTKKKADEKPEPTTTTKTRKKPIKKQKAPLLTESDDDEEIEELPVKPIKQNTRKRVVREVSETHQVEEVSSTISATKRVRKPKAKPVEEDDEEDVEEPPAKTTRVTRARRGRPPLKITEKSDDTEPPAENLTVKGKRAAKPRATKTIKRVQFVDSPPPAPVNPKKSRRLLSEEDIDQMTETIVPVAPVVRKSARSKK